MNGTKRFSVPKGKHTLKFNVTKLNPNTKEIIDEITKSYDLIASSAYVLQLDHSDAKYKKPGQLKLLLTSNAQDFKSISDDLFEPFMSERRSSSEGANHIVAFPNQIDRFLPMDRWEEVLGKGTVMADLKWSIRPLDQDPFNLVFDMRVVSEGPDVVDSGTTYKGKYRVEYLKDGMFQVLKNND